MAIEKFGETETENWAEEGLKCRQIVTEILNFGISQRQILKLLHSIHMFTMLEICILCEFPKIIKYVRPDKKKNTKYFSTIFFRDELYCYKLQNKREIATKCKKSNTCGVFEVIQFIPPPKKNYQL